MWEIDSISDSAFLEQILNAVAMVTNLSDFNTLVKIGLLLGVLLMGFQALISPQQGIDFKQLFLSWLIFSISFGPKVNVIINDVYTSEVRKIDNIPLGIATAGSLISKLGGGLTRLFEQAFSTPAMTQYGFASSLEALSQARSHAMRRQGMVGGHSQVGKDFFESWKNYVKECTLVGIDLGTLDPAMVSQHPYVVEALKFESELYGTLIYENGRPMLLDCQQAYNALKDLTELYGLPAIIGQLDPSHFEQGVISQFESRLKEALNQLGQHTVSTQRFMAAAVLLPLYEHSVISKYQDEQAFNAAMMINQAILQRNTQWAAEQSLFHSIVRPMMTFFEGFIFAITPMMGFVISLGALGIRMVGKYLLILIWIQLWLPLLSIINLYIHLGISRHMIYLSQVQSIDISSFSGMYSLDNAIQTWLATGGMLAASVPAIALMLVYGSSVTATHLSGRLQGLDTINEKMLTPDVMQVAPVLTHSSMYEGSELSGLSKTGAQQLMSQYSLGNRIDERVQSTNDYGHQSTTTSSKRLGQIVSQSIGENVSYQSLSNLGETVMTQYGQSREFLNQMADEYSKRYGFGEDQKNAVRGLIAGVLSGGLSVNKEGVATSSGMNTRQLKPAKRQSIAGIFKGDLSSSVHSENVNEQHQQSQTLTSDLIRLSQNEGLKSDFSRALSQDRQHMHQSGRQKSDSYNQEQTLSQDNTVGFASFQNYSQGLAVANSQGNSKQMDGLMMSKRISSDPELLNYLDNYMVNHPEAAHRMRQLLPIYHNLLPDQTQAYAAAAIESLTQSDSSNLAERDNDRQAAHYIMGKSLGKNTIPSMPNGERLLKQDPLIDNLKELSEEVGYGGRSALNKSDLNRRWLLGEQEFREQQPIAHAKQSAMYDNALKEMDLDKSTAQSSLNQMRRALWQPQLDKSLDNNNYAPRFFESLSSLGGQISKYGHSMGAAAGYLAQDYETYYQNALTDPGQRGFLHRMGVSTQSGFNGLKAAYEAGKTLQNPLTAFYKEMASEAENEKEGINFGTKAEAVIAGVRGAISENRLSEYLQHYQQAFYDMAYEEGIVMGLTSEQSHLFANTFTGGLSPYQEAHKGSDRHEINVNDDNHTTKAQALIKKAALSGDYASNILIPLRALNQYSKK